MFFLCRFLVVNSLFRRIKEGSKVISPDSSADLLSLIDLQVGLGSIGFSSVDQIIIRRFRHVFVKTMLDNYMGIVDNTIGSSSVIAWQKVNNNVVPTTDNCLLETRQSHLKLFWIEAETSHDLVESEVEAQELSSYFKSLVCKLQSMSSQIKFHIFLMFFSVIRDGANDFSALLLPICLIIWVKQLFFSFRLTSLLHSRSILQI